MKQQIFLLFLTLALNQCLAKFTPYTQLEIDNHPCEPEILKTQQRYICSSTGKIICQSGWTEHENKDERDPLHPCTVPICRRGCQHGECRAPDYCACEIGWEGPACNKCLPLPGCQNGYCENALECICKSEWTGAYCELPKCDSCVNGHCEGPNECVCYEGWRGANCDVCETLNGCKHGTCKDNRPNTCKCDPRWEGHLCDEPKCEYPQCVNGKCFEGINNEHFCVCETGWKGAGCDKCKPYWDCPTDGTCQLPNQCLCTSLIANNSTLNPKGLCNHESLGGTR